MKLFGATMEKVLPQWSNVRVPLGAAAVLLAAALCDEQVVVDMSRPVEPETLSRIGYGAPASATSTMVSPPVTATTGAPLYEAVALVSLVAVAELSRQSANFVVSAKLSSPVSRPDADAVGISAHWLPMSCPAAAPANNVKKLCPERWRSRW
jgi:hypothetical protein